LHILKQNSYFGKTNLKIMRPISFKKLLLIPLATVSIWLLHPQVNWAYTKKKQKEKSYKKAATAKKNNDFSFGMGKTDYRNQTLQNVHGLGRTTLYQVIVEGDTEVQGYLQATESTLNTLHVQGRAVISNTMLQVDAIIQGHTIINDGQVNSLTVQGKFFISGSTVKGLVDTQGKFEAISTTFQDKVTTMGLFEVKDAIFQKEVATSGKTVAIDTCFEATLTTIAEKILLHDVDAQDLSINKPEEDGYKNCKQCCENCKKRSSKEPQIVTLSGKTIIHGSITFESGKGIVLLGEEAKIEGKVVGGTLQKFEETAK
jgi:hypothetical protein